MKKFKRVRLRAIFYPSTIVESKNLERVRFRKKRLTTNHILKWTWFVQKPIFMNDLLEENHFSILLPRKTPNSLGMRFLKNHDMEKKWKKNSFWIKTFVKNQILKQVFNNASDFESRISKYVRFSVNSTQLVIFRIGIFTSWRILKHLFYHTSDFKQNF